MRKETKLPNFSLTPGDWAIIFDLTIRDEIRSYAKIVAKKRLPENIPLDFEHRQYLHSKHWGTIGREISHRFDDAKLSGIVSSEDEKSLITPRRIFCYAYNEEGVSYILEDHFEYLSDYDRRRFGPWTGEDEDGPVIIEFDGEEGKVWTKYVRETATTWFDNGVAYGYEDTILKHWLLTKRDVPDPLNTSPAQLDEILKKVAKEKPKELHEALERKRKENWELLELCYAEVSVKLFRQLGLSYEETIAKALQQEYFFHFGVRPAVYAYDYTLIDETERRFRRVLEEANAKYLLEHYENATKVVLPGEKV